ncbi:Methanogenic corrinoid protein MtbC1 [Jatrophihabitans endophyticus]|uniref:Methanogenic corrinoid protein MtbC1 n=1 Tax=Jatrophihabitans endophyticus TaxID=1206085 RepID=A0A1M5KWT3_9ACTN|nr:cobalamin-dependent protein [Jatrophihabitans endophyticus]SHG57196.1 Methanogenic corrinoid protein MtbC1 [Jatrophihabitans endophyticus]
MTALATDVFERYWAALAAGDTGTAVTAVLDAFDDGTALPDLLEDVVCAAQAEVGRRWAANEWNVAQEHRATSISEEAVAALASRSRSAGTSRGQVVVTCADGEWHSLPSRVLAATLRDAGWQVTYLGASVPTRHLSQLLHDVGPDVTLLSCALPLRLFHAREVIEASRAAGVPVVVGGRGFGPRGRWGLAIGANGWAANARDTAHALAAGDVPGFTEPAPPLAHPDDALERVRSARAEVATGALRVMAERLPDVAAYDDRQHKRTAEDVEFILDYLEATLLVDDVELFTEFVGWLTPLLTSRGVPAATLAAGITVVADAVAERCGELPRAAAVLAAGRAVAAR